MQRFDLKHYDGVLAFGEVLRELYIKNKLTRNAWTWHEASDTDIFYPRLPQKKEGDLVWIGNWGDNERTEELKEFIIDPVQNLGLKAVFYGVRYPKHAIELLKKANIEYRGWLPNYLVPEVFGKYRVTVHVPRRPYTESLPGIPTIRPFEAMACGIPLICSPWNDSESLFTNGIDYLSASSGNEMEAQLKAVLSDDNLARMLSENGLLTIKRRHTCEHRVIELLNIIKQLKNKHIKSLIYE
jgi:spore maturation protein CgeB